MINYRGLIALGISRCNIGTAAPSDVTSESRLDAVVVKETFSITPEGERKLSFSTEEGNYQGFVVGVGSDTRGVLIEKGFLPGYVLIEGWAASKEALVLLTSEMEAMGAITIRKDSPTVSRWPEFKRTQELRYRWMCLGFARTSAYESWES